jgi:hypothetical protein
VQVQARGPVHEAYAEPVDSRPQPSPVVPKQPPDPIPESPPDQKPEGDSVQWIPGYWAWDEDSRDFLWVSGFWREVPPNRQWVPGHWDQAEGGWQWTSGFWTSTDQEQIEYLPTPPPSIDSGPSTPASSDSDIYVPGCWVYQQTRYLWRPGFWMAYRPGWCWQPAHYVWSRAGCVFVEGYWDHPLEERGLLFAPVRFERRLWADENWSYVPQFLVQADSLIGALFVRPANCHYYFGDYFEPRYAESGFVPWIDYRVGRYAPDPMFIYYRHAFADSPHWVQGLRELYVGRRENRIPRPPHNWVEQQRVTARLSADRNATVRLGNNINLPLVHTVSVLAPLRQVKEVHPTALAALAGERHPPPSAHPIKLESVPREQVTRIQKEAQQFHAAAQERRQVETRMRSTEPAPGRPAERPRTAKLELPRPPAPADRARPNAKTPPPPPKPPRHEERPIPKAEPPRREPTPPREPAPRTPERPPEPSRREVTPPRTEPPPPRREERPAEPNRRENPPPDVRRENPPREPAPRPPDRQQEPPRREATPPRSESPAPRPPARPPEPPREPGARPPAQPPEPPRHETTPPRVGPPAPPRREPPPAPRPEPSPKKDRDK